MNVTTKGLKDLNSAEKSISFYRDLRMDEKNPELISNAIKILKTYELGKKDIYGPYPYIEIDTSYSTLSVGNLACFSISKQQLASAKQELLTMGQFFYPSNFYNGPGHKSITLLHTSNAEGALSEKGLNDLKICVSSLEEVRLLELGIDRYDKPGIRPAFLSALSGATKLPHLKGLYLHFYEEIKDLHIADLSAYFKERFKTHTLPLININCFDVTSLQLQRLISNLSAYTADPIDLEVRVRARVARHAPHCDENLLSTDLVSLKIFLTI